MDDDFASIVHRQIYDSSGTGDNLPGWNWLCHHR